MPELIRGRLIFEGGWFDHGGATAFNLYRSPQLHYGDPNAAGLWISHVRKVFGADANHIILWLATGCSARTRRSIMRLCSGKQGIGRAPLFCCRKSRVRPLKH
jgi:hypothetical protein